MNDELFLAFNNMVDPLVVTFLALEQTEDNASTLVIEFKGEVYKLLWDEYNGYYKGHIKKSGKEIEGYVL